MSQFYESCPDAVQIKNCTPDELATLKKYYTKNVRNFIRVGAPGFLLYETYKNEATNIRNMSILPTDIFVSGFMRAGTTLVKELVWLINNELNFEMAKAKVLSDRYVFMGQFVYHDPIMIKKQKELFKNDETKLKLYEKQFIPPMELLSNAQSPRFITSHIPISLLSKNLGKAKLVYVARDPRDVAVSLYNFNLNLTDLGLETDFKTFYYELFVKNLVLWSPYFVHVKEAWALRNDPNFLFVFYEELRMDLRGISKRIAKFFGKHYREEQYDELCNYLDFSNFQKIATLDVMELKALGIFRNEPNNFIRKGKAGGWRDHFDEDMTRHAEQWIEQNLTDTDLRFPQYQH